MITLEPLELSELSFSLLVANIPEYLCKRWREDPAIIRIAKENSTEDIVKEILGMVGSAELDFGETVRLYALLVSLSLKDPNSPFPKEIKTLKIKWFPEIVDFMERRRFVTSEAPVVSTPAKKRALITGISGQDAGWLAELLLSKDYEVFGLKRRTSNGSLCRVEHLLDRIRIIEGDMTDAFSLSAAVRQSRPDEIYNLAAQSFVKVSFQQPEMTGNITGLGVTRLLEAVKTCAPKAKMFHCSTSEMFGLTPPPQNENSPFHPRSPYGCAKMYAYWMTVNYRESYGMFVSNGIMFNHASRKRGPEFVSQKIAQGVASIHHGFSKTLELGNLEAKRDWGHAKDVVEAMWLVLQQDKPDDFVIGTGEAHSVRDFCQLAFQRVGLDYEKHVVINPEFYRPAEVDYLLADASKARRVLGWVPKVKFQDLVNEMVDWAVDHPEEWMPKTPSGKVSP